MDGVSVAASITGIATAGIQVSVKVVTLASQVSTAADRISSIGNDVSLTSAILHQLGSLLSENTTDGGLPVFGKGGLKTTKNSAEICQKIFEEIDRETVKASNVIRGRQRPTGEKVKLTIHEKATWPFLQPSLEVMRTDLREAKGTLMLMLQLASLALSKRVAESSTSASPNMTEQQDIVRSILMLKRQQQHDILSSSENDAEVFEDQEKRHAKTARGLKDSSAQRSTSASLTKPSGSFAPVAGSRFAKHASVRDGEVASPEWPADLTADTKSKVPRDPNNRQIDDSSPTTAGMFTPLTINSHSQAPQSLSLETQNFQGQETVISPRSQDEFTEAQLSLFTIDPCIRVGFGEVRIEWLQSNIRISQCEIHELIANYKADGLKTGWASWDALHVRERPIVADHIHGFGLEETLVALKRTEQDLQDGNMTFKAIPSFQLITEQPIHERRRVKLENTRPVHIKVHRRHVCPETLDEYNLPWTWDERNPDFIIISRWIPEHDQLILFEHTRRLRGRLGQLPPASAQSRRERGNPFGVRHRSPTRTPVSRSYTPTSERDQSSEDDFTAAHDYARGKGQKKESARAISEDGSEEDAAVNELLEKYTTFFDGARHGEEND